MALLERCFCCSLAVAASVIGIYTLIAYVIAFTMEVCWIIQTEAKLPPMAYILCGGYFLTFVFSGFLLRGLSVKRSLYLVGWLVAIGILSFPEAGLVLFMSIYYWKVRSFYGLTELTCWLCRLVVNIAGVICIHSLYSTWKEEKQVIRSLQGLQMKSMERPRRHSVISNNGQMKNGLAYQNVGFSASSSDLNTPANPTLLRRSASSLSQASVSQQFRGGHFPIHVTGPRPEPDISLLETAEFKTTSEFDASNFDMVLASAMRNPSYESTGVLPLSRAQSMVDLFGNGRVASSVDYPMFGRPREQPTRTQSLDRRLSRASRSRSLADLDYFITGDGRMRSAYFSPAGVGVRRPSFIHRPPYPGIEYSLMPPFPFPPTKPKSNSRTSLGNESDDFQKYRDVAL